MATTTEDMNKILRYGQKGKRYGKRKIQQNLNRININFKRQKHICHLSYNLHFALS